MFSVFRNCDQLCNYAHLLPKPGARIWVIRNYPEIRICELGAQSDEEEFVSHRITFQMAQNLLQSILGQ